MKIPRLVALIVIAAGLNSCVSPYYGTARIEEGHSLSIGGAASSHFLALGEYFGHNYGLRGDLEWRYGFNERWQINAHFGAGLGIDGKYVEGVAPYPPFNTFIDPSLGLQYAFLKGPVIPALRIEVCLTPGFIAPFPAPTLLLGFGNPEWLTFGSRVKLPHAVESFVSVHPDNNISIFAGIDWLSSLDKDFPLIGAAGISYNFRIGRKNEND
ncbi:hypothetical protein GF359_02135 [candidate division WOR-3 bacterium]|uniref:Uncharacterized protein n=1 Tax=candidate division WOR-3 bacterium TaxID=2052148 RepID=A0A9D5K830_UNCW3|nr:hypothetical protein [candidate division WOR-3 bacterium]MBD3363992.1 hypothetical protein [candidate division WOR-3 bacterium]